MVRWLATLAQATTSHPFEDIRKWTTAWTQSNEQILEGAAAGTGADLSQQSNLHRHGAAAGSSAVSGLLSPNLPVSWDSDRRLAGTCFEQIWA